MEQQVTEKVEPKMDEVVNKEPDDKKSDVNKEQWDKSRQQIDQLQSVIEKVQIEKTEIANKVTSAQSKIDDLESKLNAKADADKLTMEELDPALVGDGIPKNFKKIHDELIATKTVLADLQKRANVYEAAERNREAESYRKNIENEICAELDDEFESPKYRTEAVRLANKWVFDEKKEKVPTDRLDAFKVLRKAYKQIVENTKQVTKKVVPSDSGVGGVAVNIDDIKSGSRAEVLSQLRNKFKKTS